MLMPTRPILYKISLGDLLQEWTEAKQNDTSNHMSDTRQHRNTAKHNRNANPHKHTQKIDNLAHKTAIHPRMGAI